MSSITRSRQPPALLILIGPKGSGKTHIGTIIERRLGVRFLRAEPIFLAHTSTHTAIEQVEQHIDCALAGATAVAIESTGAAPDYIRRLLQRHHRGRLIRVSASAETCWRRFEERDRSAHIPVSDERFREMNELAVQAEFEWDCMLANDAALSDEDIEQRGVGGFALLEHAYTGHGVPVAASRDEGQPPLGSGRQLRRLPFPRDRLARRRVTELDPGNDGASEPLAGMPELARSGWGSSAGRRPALMRARYSSRR